ncbi:hypothetical protein SDC9_75173 [bioreactor metagenome]|uniref:Uncharacterized protein n=1 Tax=bioreactor metagenome TaxID=1076179 RepID=A0A644YJI1_9ZZZZ
MLLADQRAELGVGVFGHAELPAFDLALHLCHEAIEDRALDIHALGAQAHLAAVDEGRTQRAFDGGVEVAVGKHDGGVLAAHLHADRARALGCGLHDDFAGACLAGEGDGVHVGVRGDEFACGIRAEAVHHVVHAGRNARLVHHFAEQGCGLRGFLRRLDDHGVAAGQCRAHLPRHQQQGQVPRADDAHHAHRRAVAVVDGALAVGCGHLEKLGGNILHHIGEDLEIGRAARDVDVAGNAARLAGVGTFGGEEFVEAAVDAVGQGIEPLHALGHGHACPGAVQRGLGGGDGGIHLVAIRLVHLGNQLAGEGGALVEGAAGGDVLAIDEVFDFFHVLSHLFIQLGSHSALSPACAISASCSSLPPDTPMPPMRSPFSTTGSPPPNATKRGRSTRPARTASEWL